MDLNVVWFRRDLRISDNVALFNATKDGNPVLPIFILDKATENTGAAFKLRLGLSLQKFSESLRKVGSRLILLKGEPIEVLKKIVFDFNAKKIFWNSLYDEDSINRDTKIKSFFEKNSISVSASDGMLLLPPWKVKTTSGSFYKVFTPFWKAYAKEDLEIPLPSPSNFVSPSKWPESESLKDWKMDQNLGKGKLHLIERLKVGEEEAKARLDDFIEKRIDQYSISRDRLDIVDSSHLSENLAYGEISARQIWNVISKLNSVSKKNREMFIRQLAWRDFAWYLCFHSPHILKRNWKDNWDVFPWRDNADALRRWQRGITGEPLVDAGMREMYVTGRMHNRVRMIVASYLTKHLLIDWRHGLKWFADCLIDWDPASNALGWQWVAGSGPDASPFFRVFNPEIQAKKFDPNGIYRTRFLGGGSQRSKDALAYFEMAPKSWGLRNLEYPKTPIIDLKVGRDRALASYVSFKNKELSELSA